MIQAVFKFEDRHDYSLDNFFVADNNREAYDYITQENWPNYAVNIYGPEGSGKTFLSKFADDNVTTIEDITNDYDEEKLFHLLNSVKENSGRILLTSEQPLSEINFKLADLKSRLAAILSIKIDRPDNEFFYHLLMRYFAAKQVKVSDDVISYLITRLERSFEAARDVVNKIDRLSLEQKRNITVPLVKQIL